MVAETGGEAAIAERRQPETLGLFEVLADHSPNMVFINRLGRVVYANKECERALGYKREEFYAPDFDFLDLIAPEYRPVAKASFTRHAGGEETAPYEYALLTKDGHRIESHITTKLIEYDGEAAILRVVTDTSARKHAEEEMKRSERMLTVMNQVAGAFLTVPDEGAYREVLEIILEATESEHGLFGYVDAKGAFVCPALTPGILARTDTPDEGTAIPREEWRGIWGQALREGVSKCSNEPLTVADGCIPMERALDVPILHLGRVIGNVMVGNKESDYIEEDKEFLEAVAVQIAPVLESRLRRDRQARKRQRVEASLRRSNEFSETVIDSLPGVFYIFDTDGRFLRWNENLERTTGYSSEEVTRMMALDLIPPEHRDGVQQMIMDVIAKGHSHAEAALQAKDGTVTPQLFTGRRITLDQRQCVAGVGIDISEQKEAEESLRQSERRFSMAFHGAPMGISINRIRDGVFLDANESFLRLLEYERDEVVNNRSFDVMEVFDEEDRRRYLEALAEGAMSLRDFETRIHTKSGMVRYVLLSVEPVELEGKACLLVMSMDITDQKQSQRELIQSEKLAGIGTLASGIAHEINNPLSGVTGYAEAILHETDLERVKEYADRILDSAERASKVVKWLSTYSRKGVDSDVTDVDLVDVMERASESLKLTRTSIATEVSMDLSHVSLVRGNATELEQLFINILSNSADAMPDGGEIRIGTRCEDGSVEVRIEDTGMGIPNDQLDKVFDPFFTTKEVGRGTGLGLYVASMIVAKHHGTITIDSTEGKGTVVRVKLPETVGSPASERSTKAGADVRA